jgi:hypothetical protein
VPPCPLWCPFSSRVFISRFCLEPGSRLNTSARVTSH